ncbi:23S rRNA (guanine745-N1)-methyltransferase [Agromyces flavus]|uniref:23S rRNA (Guanine745-N1)-methyltransferase n=1 Tax=Agromyces flavus TaxID=589382 RepID=A0A1H1RN02_9MICO|nr:methyltransferase [Agromyces flavus]MCP2368847.1 23S rRNA (guanine745-N1)-methyltransferase [Agromyces flavus]GGI48303.1 ubiquinone biosynthesis protein [Agromyces flavus]SDS37075.1 23S rRNA m(1)G-748 methyltransferase [Agromyces flavus]
MSIDSTWLRCPNCFSDLSPVDERVFGCDRGHRFDRAKQGYLTLLPPKAPRTVGDDRAMLDARAALLGSGAYRPIADEILHATAIDSAGGTPSIADLGCGTGYYSQRIAEAHPGARFLLADRSADAVRASLRSLPDGTGIVMDIWRPFPIRSAVADVVLNVFAPRNPAEFARILHASGRVVVVVPRVGHLAELRRAGLLLDVPPEKASTTTERLDDAGLIRRSAATVEYRIEADGNLRRMLSGMGPSAHHAASTADVSDDTSIEVTVSVDVLGFGHRSGSASG